MPKRCAFLYLKDMTNPTQITSSGQQQKTKVYNSSIPGTLPPSLSMPIHCPKFSSVNYSFQGFPHQLSLQPVPSVKSLQLDWK